MHLVLIDANLPKQNFIPFGYFPTNGFQFFIDFGTTHHAPIFRWTHDLVDHDRYLMPFANQLTHCEILADATPIGNPISGAASCGECTLILIQANHAAYYADFMVKREHDLKNGNQLVGLTLIDPDFENVRLSWHYVVDHHQWELAPKFRYSLWFSGDLRARFPDILAMAAYAIDVLKTLPSSAEVQLNIGRMLAWSSWFHQGRAFHERARQFAEEAVELLQGFDEGIEDLIIAYHTFVRLAVFAEDSEFHLTRAKQSYALAEKLGDLTWLGQTAMFAAFIGRPAKEITFLNLAKK